MFDTHCHLDADEYAPDLDQVLARSFEAGVSGIFVPGYHPSEWRTLPAFCARDRRLSFGLGLHPWYLEGLAADDFAAVLAELEGALAQSGAVALGECGLDALHGKRGGTKLASQVLVLDRQLELARRYELPVVLHCVRAHGALLELLEARPPLPAGGVLHSYSGPPELVERYVKLGLSFSFAGTLTREDARKPKAAARVVPLARLLVESDGPDQAPRELGTQRAEPMHVALVLGALSALRGVPEAELRAQTCANAEQLFGRLTRR